MSPLVAPLEERQVDLPALIVKYQWQDVDQGGGRRPSDRTRQRWSIGQDSGRHSFDWRERVDGCPDSGIDL